MFTKVFRTKLAVEDFRQQDSDEEYDEENDKDNDDLVYLTIYYHC
jgi:hypothetical protein